MITKTYAGLITEGRYSEADDIIFLSDSTDPLGERLRDDIANKNVSARYWITETKMGRDEAISAFLKVLFGASDCEFCAVYTEETGYLWTDEECKIGGHDLLAELRSHVGKWLILEIDIHS